MEQSSHPTNSASTEPSLTKMRPWDKDTSVQLDVGRPFLAYTDSDISYVRHEPHIQRAYHVGVRLNERITFIGGTYSYLHVVHQWIYLDEVVELGPIGRVANATTATH